MFISPPILKYHPKNHTPLKLKTCTPETENLYPWKSIMICFIYRRPWYIELFIGYKLIYPNKEIIRLLPCWDWTGWFLIFWKEKGIGHKFHINSLFRQNKVILQFPKSAGSVFNKSIHALGKHIGFIYFI